MVSDLFATSPIETKLVLAAKEAWYFFARFFSGVSIIDINIIASLWFLFSLKVSVIILPYSHFIMEGENVGKLGVAMRMIKT